MGDTHSTERLLAEESAEDEGHFEQMHFDF